MAGSAVLVVAIELLLTTCGGHWPCSARCVSCAYIGAPPLAGSEWVQGSPNRLIRIPLYGLGGPITVKGQQMNFPAPMPPIGAALQPDDLAAILSYVRQAWGNKAPTVTPEQVKAVGTQVGNRPTAFSPEEIMQVPEK